MKLRKVKIRVEDIETTKARWTAALRGKAARRDMGAEDVITVSSWDVLNKILSAPRLQILTAIPSLKPKSISALAKAMKKDFKNVHSDVKFLADLGLIDLRKEGSRRTLVPVAKFDGIEFAFAG